MILSANAVRIAYAFAADSDIRYYLNGVNVEPAPGGGALITATNGHMMVQVHDTDASNVEPAIISLSKATRSFLKRGTYVSTEFEEKRIAVLSGDRVPLHLQFERYEIEAKYPDIQAVLGAREDWTAGFQGAFNVSYLAQISLLLDEVVDKRHRLSGCVSFYSRPGKLGTNEDQGPVLFILEGRFKAWGMVMPMRGDERNPLDVAYGKAA
ncbi:hypothetical protein [Paraburkholderia terrae]|uniref:hypothetical protein n=1 Tax=Paraburkholderia terrae TaxID=311230 RepID=UPI001EE1566A|nr:hypothetical protein [Paraburkholderia terrae]GJH00247.1 hypothetical protein CBA19C8_06840 [Paraburkholderia terrae]